MCGIAGIVTANAREYSRNLTAMVASLGHRGPDQSGSYFFDGCALGHTRLSLIDLATGDQPLLAFNKKSGVVFNGEIYGYRQIKNNLPSFPFRTSSDTEVILALHRQDKKNFVRQLPGMFSFALWDEEERTLVCARDRFGEKPFYYAFGPKGEFIFASEIKAILASQLVSPIIDREQIAHYLKYLYVDPKRTVFKNIFTLPPAHILSRKQDRTTVERYWSPPLVRHAMNLDEAVEEFRSLLRAAVGKQLIADVPVGAFLSGGLDSSTIVAIASSLQQKLTTFSFAFENHPNELAYAKEIADKYNTHHIELSDRDDNIAGLILKMADIYDEPFADSSNIPTYLISRQAKRHVKAVLTGDGGDELVGGYSWYGSILKLQQLGPIGPLRPLVLKIIAQILAKTSYQNPYLAKYKFYRRRPAANFLASAYDFKISNFTDTELKALGLKSDFMHTHPWHVTGTVNDIMLTDLENYLPGDILVKIDRASMANGLELRAPFLDIDFASFCLSLPHRLKINSTEDKIILRRAFSELWTESIRRRPKKGFGAPVAKWLRQNGMIQLRDEYLSNQQKKIFNLVDFDQVQKIIPQADYRSWSLLVLSVWLEKNNFPIA